MINETRNNTSSLIIESTVNRCAHLKSTSIRTLFSHTVSMQRLRRFTWPQCNLRLPLTWHNSHQHRWYITTFIHTDSNILSSSTFTTISAFLASAPLTLHSHLHLHHLHHIHIHSINFSPFTRFLYYIELLFSSSSIPTNVITEHKQGERNVTKWCLFQNNNTIVYFPLRHDPTHDKRPAYYYFFFLYFISFFYLVSLFSSF